MRENAFEIVGERAAHDFGHRPNDAADWVHKPTLPIADTKMARRGRRNRALASEGRTATVRDRPAFEIDEVKRAARGDVALRQVLVQAKASRQGDTKQRLIAEENEAAQEARAEGDGLELASPSVGAARMSGPVIQDA